MVKSPLSRGGHTHTHTSFDITRLNSGGGIHGKSHHLVPIPREIRERRFRTERGGAPQLSRFRHGIDRIELVGALSGFLI